MRIHFHTDNYWFSGSEVTLLALAEAAATDPATTSAFTYRSGPEYDPGLARQVGPTTRPVALPLPDPEAVKARLVAGLGAWSTTPVAAVARLVGLRRWCLGLDVVRLTRLFRRSRPDVVHVNNGGFPGAISCNAAVLAARLAGVPGIVYVVNNLAVGYDAPGRRWDGPVDRAVRAATSMFVTGSDAAGQELARVLDLGPGDRVVIPNTAVVPEDHRPPLDVRRELGIAPEAPVVLVAARLEVRKGHRHLFAAVRGLLDAGEDRGVVVLVAGDGPERAALEGVVEQLGLVERIRFLGPRADVWDLLHATDVVVLPSVAAEDFPVAILEAMAAGRPVVSTRVAGIPEQVVDGETGCLLDPGDEVGLQVALAALLADAPLRQRMGAAARVRFGERFAPDAVVARYRQLHHELARRPGAPTREPST